MANITLNQLSSATHELTQNESNAIVGGGFISTLRGLTTIGQGILALSDGIKILKNPNLFGSSGGNPSVSLAFQEFYAPDFIAGV